MNNIRSVGVIVIAYNGEDYILKQLKSIKDQSLTPNCVLIFDDCSMDNTVPIIKNFIKEYELQNWKIFPRKDNVGWRKNAYIALTECNTDIIFWSDQDDVWFENKIEEMFKIMMNNDCLAVYSSWQYIDSSDKILDIRTGTDTGKIFAVNPFLRREHIPPLLGCSACFRKELIGKLPLIVPCIYDSPDVILCLLGITLGKILYMDLPLFQRRIHENNVTLTHVKRSWKFSYLRKMKDNILLNYQYDMLNKFINEIQKLHESFDIAYASAEKKYLWYRLNFLRKHNNIMKYLFFSIKQNCLSDFFYAVYSDIVFIIVDIFKKLLLKLNIYGVNKMENTKSRYAKAGL